MRQLLQLAEYVGVDYSAAVANGRVINSGEYTEMKEFAGLIGEKVEKAPQAVRPEMHQLVNELKQLIIKKANAEAVVELTSELRATLLSALPKLSLPSTLVSEKQTKRLFQQNCALCHGAAGQGDGPGTAGLEPAPTDFTDRERANNRSLLGLFDAVSDGIDGTAMASFSHLSEEERWALTFYVGSLAFNDNADSEQKVPLNELINYSPNNLLQRGFSSGAIDYSRTHTHSYFSESSENNPIAIARITIDRALTAYQASNYSEAKRLAISAYLDGFELAESALSAKAPELMRTIERDMMALRGMAGQPGKRQQVTEIADQLQNQLNLAANKLLEDQLSGSALFTASAVILLREGLEALLIVLAMGTVLARSGRKDGLRYVHAGWITALIAGFGTWLLAEYVIGISGASREIIEGAAALLAAIILFYVGYWMHSKTQSQQWQRFIQERVQTQLNQGAFWGLAGLAFLAVYREVFETVLFYQSLLLQAQDNTHSVAYGFIFGVVILAVVAWAVIKYSIKLPMSTFFKITTYIILALVFILLGKGISALQEAAWLSHTAFPVDVSFDWLGVSASWESLGAQLVYVILVFTLFKRRTSSKLIKIG
ncbi:cytochrome c/FTR1 family iron permease [Idiomarina sp. X4]|uniref:cytochrome c/FTR1 family iron permease n=1 Tax=Idiomarina sp. X4 TaxID=2055892 RepID=UPI001E3F76B0|nr:cytochrome c/FTR1 family iron permease [Idiomarina sp. X4]